MTETYTFSEASGAAPDSPVLFLFHGTGGDEHQFMDLGPQLLAGARLVAPRGDVSEGGMLRFFKRLAEGRYDMADFARASAKMSRFVTAQKGAAASTIGFGYSNGANVLAGVMLDVPQTFDIAVLLHPLIPFEPADQPGLKGKKILITAGRRDGMCPAPQTQGFADWLTAQGADVTLFWHEGGHEIRQDELLAVRDFLTKAAA